MSGVASPAADARVEPARLKELAAGLTAGSDSPQAERAAADEVATGLATAVMSEPQQSDHSGAAPTQTVQPTLAIGHPLIWPCVPRYILPLLSACRHALDHVLCALQSERFRQQARGSLLLQAFCAAHGLAPDMSRLMRLAQSNDWIHFLAEASSPAYPHHMVRRLDLAPASAWPAPWMVTCFAALVS